MPSEIIGEIQLSPNSDGVNWTLLSDIRCEIGGIGPIKIPQGFETDLASVPWFFWRVFPKATGRYRTAAIVHDWLYEDENCSKYVADAIFLDLMKDAGVGWLKRRILYAAVYLGGGLFRETK